MRVKRAAIRSGILIAVLSIVATCVAPVLFSHYAAAFDPLAPPPTSAKAVFVEDATLQAPLYALNPDEQRSPASTTKLATALVVVRQISDLNEHVLIDQSDVLDASDGQSMVGILAGDVLTVEQLMYGILLNSGNDASHALARHIGGKILASEGVDGDPTERFVQEMNAVVSALGLENSHFTNPAGLYDPEHYTTARDLAAIAAEAFADPLIARISAVDQIDITSVGPVPQTYGLVNTNRMLGQDGVNGGKTGTLSESGACLVVTRTGPGGNLIVGVLLGSDIEFDENEFQIPESDRRYDDMETVLRAMDQDYRWIVPTDNNVMPGLQEEMAVWDVQLKDTHSVVLPADQSEALRYLLQLGPPADAESEVGRLLLFNGDLVVGQKPVYQVGGA